MEVPGGLNNKKYICLNEIFSTAMLFIAINWGQSAVVVSLAVGIVVIMAGGVGGCNVNPAVTLGILIKERDDKKQKTIFFFQIMISQILGAILGVSISTLGLYTGGNGSPQIEAPDGTTPPILQPQDLLSTQLKTELSST